MNSSYRNIAGIKFGRLTPRCIHSRKPLIWECDCECGKITYSRSNPLINGNTKSCGCWRVEIAGNMTRKRPYEALYNNFRATCGREVYISFEEFLKFITIEECHYCAATITWPKYRSNNNVRNSGAYYLDRKENNKGYTMDNVVVCCSRCNRCKSDQFTYLEWIEIGKTIRRLRENKQSVGATNET